MVIYKPNFFEIEVFKVILWHSKVINTLYYKHWPHYQMTHNLYLKGKLEYQENTHRDPHIAVLVVACCCLVHLIGVDLNR